MMTMKRRSLFLYTRKSEPMHESQQIQMVTASTTRLTMRLFDRYSHIWSGILNLKIREKPFFVALTSLFLSCNSWNVTHSYDHGQIQRWKSRKPWLSPLPFNCKIWSPLSA